MHQKIVQTIKQKLNRLPFGNFFSETTILVPIPNSTLMQKDSLWIPYELAKEFEIQKLGIVQILLTRKQPIQKSAYSQTRQRPSYAEQFATLEVPDSLNQPENIVLIDDVITSGTTIGACYKKLHEKFPYTKIRAFASIRTMSGQSKFMKIEDPCLGKIKYYDHYTHCFREP